MSGGDGSLFFKIIGWKEIDLFYWSRFFGSSFWLGRIGWNDGSGILLNGWGRYHLSLFLEAIFSERLTLVLRIFCLDDV